jgi:hypothetical protein
MTTVAVTTRKMRGNGPMKTAPERRRPTVRNRMTRITGGLTTTRTGSEQADIKLVCP